MEKDEEIERIKNVIKELPAKGIEHPFKTVIKSCPPEYLCPYPCLK